MKSPKKRVKMLLDNNFQPDVRVYKYKIISKFKMFIYFIWLIKFGCQTKTYLKKDSAYCYLHCHDLMMAALAAIILKDKLLVFDMHEYYLKGDNSKRDWMLQKILTYTQNKAAYIIYVNNFQLKGISEENVSSYQTILISISLRKSTKQLHLKSELLISEQQETICH